MLKSKLLFLAILFLIISFGFPLEKAQESPRIMLVLDASGSMWGEIEGKTKIEIAREVIAEILKKVDPNVEIGLVVYGHRRKDDCNDIETLIPIGKSTASKIIGTVNSINPKGKTPLSHAVQHAAKELRHTEKRATVVLISDGIETCNVDPCKIGKKLKMGGIDFTTHVIGFDVKGEDQVGLRCLASNTGGLFLPAGNAGELFKAFTKVVVKAQEAPKPIVKNPGPASLKAPAQVAAGSVFKVEWEGPNSRNDFIAVVDKEVSDRTYWNYAYTDTGNPVMITALEKPGKYELRYVYDSLHTWKILARAAITITPVTATVEGPAQVEAGSPFKVKWTGPNNPADHVTIVPEGAGNREYLSFAYTKGGSPGEITAPDNPGAYEIRYITGQSRKILARAKITVISVSATLDFPSSVPAGSPIIVKWTGPNYEKDYITIAPKGSPDRKYLNFSYTSEGSPLTLQATDKPGKYEIRYIMNRWRKALARRDITLTSVTAKVSAPATVKAGKRFNVSWQGPNHKRDSITIAEVGAKDNKYLSRSYTKKGSPVTLRAPYKPGKYEVRYVLRQSITVLARTTVTVE
ncbi:MAG: VWA domain-containing protein [bacterium]|nr:VWA domain-containing protein [bacterium]